MKHRPLSISDGYAVTYATEGDQDYIGTHQDVEPVIKHVKKVRDMHSFATKSSNPNEWRHVGSVPIAIIIDWCRRNGYRFDQWARNEDGAKDKFLKYFMSREFSKLHNNHVTTKKESSQIVVPNYIGSK